MGPLVLCGIPADLLSYLLLHQKPGSHPGPPWSGNNKKSPRKVKGFLIQASSGAISSLNLAWVGPGGPGRDWENRNLDSCSELQSDISLEWQSGQLAKSWHLDSCRLISRFDLGNFYFQMVGERFKVITMIHNLFLKNNNNNTDLASVWISTTNRDK